MATTYRRAVLPVPGLRIKRLKDGRIIVYRVDVITIGELDVQTYHGRKMYVVNGKVFSDAQLAAEALAEQGGK